FCRLCLFSSPEPALTAISPLSLHDALPIFQERGCARLRDIAIGVSAPGHSRPTGLGHKFPLVIGRRERLQLSHLFQHGAIGLRLDRKSTRLNSSHVSISYAVFCLKKKNTTT